MAFAIGIQPFLLTGCSSPESPAEISLQFWQQLSNHKIDSARKFCRVNSQELPENAENRLKNRSLSSGKIILDGNLASVEIIATKSDNSPPSNFKTFLVKDNERWAIDCEKTAQYFSGDFLFHGIIKDLNQLGDDLNEKLEEKIPLIEKSIESFGDELKKQIDKFGQELEKSFPPPQNTSPGDQSEYENSV